MVTLYDQAGNSQAINENEVELMMQNGWGYRNPLADVSPDSVFGSSVADKDSSVISEESTIKHEDGTVEKRTISNKNSGTPSSNGGTSNSVESSNEEEEDLRRSFMLGEGDDSVFTSRYDGPKYNPHYKPDPNAPYLGPDPTQPFPTELYPNYDVPSIGDSPQDGSDAQTWEAYDNQKKVIEKQRLSERSFDERAKDVFDQYIAEPVVDTLKVVPPIFGGGAALVAPKIASKTPEILSSLKTVGPKLDELGKKISDTFDGVKTWYNSGTKTVKAASKSDLEKAEKSLEWANRFAPPGTTTTRLANATKNLTKAQKNSKAWSNASRAFTTYGVYEGGKWSADKLNTAWDGLSEEEKEAGVSAFLLEEAGDAAEWVWEHKKEAAAAAIFAKFAPVKGKGGKEFFKKWFNKAKSLFQKGAQNPWVQATVGGTAAYRVLDDADKIESAFSKTEETKIVKEAKEDKSTVRAYQSALNDLAGNPEGSEAAASIIKSNAAAQDALENQRLLQSNYGAKAARTLVKLAISALLNSDTNAALGIEGNRLLADEKHQREMEKQNAEYSLKASNERAKAANKTAAEAVKAKAATFKAVRTDLMKRNKLDDYGVPKNKGFAKHLDNALAEVSRLGIEMDYYDRAQLDAAVDRYQKDPKTSILGNFLGDMAVVDAQRSVVNSNKYWNQSKDFEFADENRRDMAQASVVIFKSSKNRKEAMSKQTQLYEAFKKMQNANPDTVWAGRFPGWMLEQVNK